MKKKTESKISPTKNRTAKAVGKLAAKSAVKPAKHIAQEFEGRRAFESNHVIPDKYLQGPSSRD